MANHDIDFEAVLGGIDGEVATRVAGAHHQHPTALDVIGVPILARMDLGTVEDSRHLRYLLVPQVPIGDQYTVVGVSSRGCRDDPARRADWSHRVHRRDGQDFGVEGDPFVMTAAARVGVDVIGDLVAMREMRIVFGHRKAAEHSLIP